MPWPSLSSPCALLGSSPLPRVPSPAASPAASPAGTPFCEDELSSELPLAQRMMPCLQGDFIRELLIGAALGTTCPWPIPLPKSFSIHLLGSLASNRFFFFGFPRQSSGEGAIFPAAQSYLLNESCCQLPQPAQRLPAVPAGPCPWTVRGGHRRIAASTSPGLSSLGGHLGWQTLQGL